MSDRTKLIIGIVLHVAVVIAAFLFVVVYS